MHTVYIENIKAHREIRKNLIDLKALLKDEKSRSQAVGAVREAMDVFTGLLSHEDAKIRKNAALILGEIGAFEALEPLSAAYAEEETLFVRPAYLFALAQLDYRSVLPMLKERFDELTQMEILPQERKHLDEERHLLAELLHMAEGTKNHSYVGRALSKVILMTKRGRETYLYRELMERMPGCSPKKMSGGVMAAIHGVDDILSIRPWYSMLFVFCKDNGFKKDARAIARGIFDSQALAYLGERHDGGDTWRFRVDVHTRDEGRQRADLAKGCAAALEALGSGRLINSVSDYEVEFVLMEGRDSKIFVYLRLYTLKDQRFGYRRAYVASSMNPVNAAQVLAAIKPYLKNEANVLDPFCGVGTLLAERYFLGGQNKNLRVRGLYGVDIYGDAIEGGRTNCEAASCPVHFIHKDFFDFTHQYGFDEVITDMPAKFENGEEKYSFYRRFFTKLTRHLNLGGRVFVYTGEQAVMERVLGELPDFLLRDTLIFSEKKHTAVYVLELRS